MSAGVKLPPEDETQKVETRVEYPTRQSPDYGKQFCGGIAVIPCPAGKQCVDDPSDDCDPQKGGADCGGICVDEKGK